MKPAATATQLKLTRARTQLLLNQPFFGALCLRLKLIPGPVPTMATNGSVILYSPAFVDELTGAELEGVLCHEVLHCALGHHCRRGERDRRLWNEAADFAINPLVLKNGLSLPEGALVDPNYDNLSAEEIYARLSQESSGSGNTAKPDAGGGANQGQQGATPQPQTGPNSRPQNQAEPGGSGPAKAEAPPALAPRPGGFGEVLDATDDEGNSASEAEKSRQQHEWRIAADQAAQLAKSCGHEPADLERHLRENRQSKQDWRALLRAFVAATTASDYRWTPPNRRYVASGLYLPSVERSGVGEIVIAVDTSGSIGSDELEQFAGEISAISDEASPEAIHVVYCDAAVQSVQEFGSSEPVKLEPKGGGGTNFRPVFEWVEQNGIAPACLIYLTDLCCTKYPGAPDYPVLWATDSRRAAPFGETIRIGD